MRLAWFAVATVVVGALAGCTTTTTTICVDYVGPMTPAEAGDMAALVLVGTVAESTGGIQVYGEFAPVHRVDVETVVSGELPTGTTHIDVVATPQTCNGVAGAFPDGDPLDVDGRVELFLFEDEDDGEYRLLTPWDGVEAAPVGQPLPWIPEG